MASRLRESEVSLFAAAFLLRGCRAVAGQRIDETFGFASLVIACCLLLMAGTTLLVSPCLFVHVHGSTQQSNGPCLSFSPQPRLVSQVNTRCEGSSIFTAPFQVLCLHCSGIMLVTPAEASATYGGKACMLAHPMQNTLRLYDARQCVLWSRSHQHACAEWRQCSFLLQQDACSL